MIYPIAPARRVVLNSGEWKPGETNDGKRTATVACPRCGSSADLSPRSHRINGHGQVMNAWTCPSRCGFVSALALHEWAASSIETEASR